MTVSELIIEEAAGRGLRHYFGLPGSGDLMDIMEAGRVGGVDFVSVAHESTAAVAAAYYGHLMGAAGLALAIKGPGAANLVGGAAMAHFERKPVVCVCESVPDDGGPEYVAQKCDHSGLFRSVVKHADVITPSNAGSTVPGAFSKAYDYPPGPVLVDLPVGTARRECGATAVANAAVPSSAPIEPARLHEANSFLASIERPVVLVGSGAHRAGAAQEVVELVKRLGAVVLSTMDARGLYDETGDRFAGVFAGLTTAGSLANKVLSEADGVILIGVDALMTEGPWLAEAPTLEILARKDLPALTRPKVRVNGDIKGIVSQLSPTVNPDGYPLDLAARMRQTTLTNFARPRGARLAVQDVIEVSRNLLPRDGVLFSETGVFVLMLEHLWPVSRPDTFFGTTAGRTMGLMIPALIGGKMARPDLPMMGIGADGSTLMRLGELEVLAREKIAAPIVVINDGSLGTIKSRQKAKGLTEYSLDLADVDFALVAQACGLNGVKVETPQQYEKELAVALQANRATVIDVRVDAEAYRDSFGPTTGGV